MNAPATKTIEKTHKAKLIRKAVRQSERTKKQSFLDQLFAQLFSGLVYSQIWEDPVVDLAAMEINETHHIVTIASGGCNVMNYLMAKPAKITAVDLNRAHVALTRTKLCAAQNFPDHKTFYDFFAVPNNNDNQKSYDKYLSPNLDKTAKNYWQGRDKTMRRRSRYFTDNIYHRGLLGNFIGLSHFLAKAYGIKFDDLLNAKSIDEQTEFFEKKLSPLLDKKLITWITSHPASLYGLGIPPAQYTELAKCADGDMAEVLRQRLRKLCCDYDINQNYFAWQAFGRQYSADASGHLKHKKSADAIPVASGQLKGTKENHLKHKDAVAGGQLKHKNDNGALPPYLQVQNYEAVKAFAKNVSVHQASITDKLNSMEPGSVDRVVLLDAQDWMDDETLNELWDAITRAAAPNAKVIFRTAGIESILPGRVKNSTLTKWAYQADQSKDYTKKDRSAIYGGFHLYNFIG
ncbi:MAG: DUF3419 family protein [Hyphomicrobiales bacterium]